MEAARRNGSLLWAAQFVSAMGDAVFLPCFAWLASELSGSEAPVGFAVFLATLPHLLFGPVAGALADHVDRRRLLVASDLLRAALLIGVALLALQGGIGFGLLVATAFLLAAFSAPFMAARDAYLPELVPAASLPRWNAALQTSQHLALIVGLGTGGLLLERDGASEVTRAIEVIGLDGLTFIVSAALLLLIRAPRRAPRAAARSREGKRLRTVGSVLADTREGLQQARKDPVVKGLLVLSAFNNLAIMGPAIVGAVLLVKQVFGLPPGYLAWFEGAMALGMLLGAITVARMGRQRSMVRVFFTGLIVDGLTYIPFLWLPSYPVCIAMIFAHGFFIPWIVVGRTSLVQAHVPGHQRGRVFALVNLTVLGMTSLSALLSGLIAAWAGTRVLFGLAGVFGALTGALGMLWIGRRLEAAWQRGRARQLAGTLD